jgi:DNA-binding response OmpR family regulator
VSHQQDYQIDTKAGEGVGTVLLAEADPVVRTALRRTLENAKYSVLEARSGEEAIDICRCYEGPIDLFLSDLSLPGMHGPTLARLVTAARPLTRLLFLTGEPEEINSRAGICSGCWLLIRKPFRPRELAHALQHFLRRQTFPAGSTASLTQVGLADSL